MGAVLGRLQTNTQATPVPGLVTVLTVPAATVFVVKSLIATNARTDGQVVPYTMYKVQSGDSLTSAPAYQKGIFLANKSIAPGELQIFEYQTLCMEAGDTLQVYTTISGVWFEAHGLTIT